MIRSLDFHFLTVAEAMTLVEPLLDHLSAHPSMKTFITY